MKLLKILIINNYLKVVRILPVCLIAASLFSTLPCGATGPAEFTLGWDANQEPDLAGYEVYYRKGVPGSKYKFLAEVYVDELEDPDNPMVTITDLYNGILTDTISPVVRAAELANNSTYHFALTALNTHGKTSDFSEELCVEVIGSSVVECLSAEGGGESGGVEQADNSEEGNDSAETDTDSSGGDPADSSSASAEDIEGGAGGGCFIAASFSGFRETD